MALDSSAFATNFTGELDKIITDKSAVGFLEDNAFKAKFVGAKTVKVPNIALQGLGSYDRDNGFTKGTLNISNTAYTMTQDRSRSFNIDREDLDETGIAELAGEVLGEFVRTKVVPEIDAYTLSKLYQVAEDNGSIIYDYSLEKPFKSFIELADEVQRKVGMDEEIICFMSRYFWNLLRKSEEFSKVLDISHMKKGEITLEVNKIDNIRIIPVSETRMQTAFNFGDGSGNTEGGFTPKDDASQIYMLMCPKKAISLVKKSEKIRIFTPDQNIDCDAYKFDYRIYYDAFVKSDLAESIYAIKEPSLSIDDDLPSTLPVQAGESESIYVTLNYDDVFDIGFQWYSCDDENGSHPKRLRGENESSFYISSELEAGNYYYYVTITCASKVIRSNIVKVTVS